MAYTNFNRHESMSKEVFEQIGSLLHKDLYEYEITTEQRRSVTNELFGLYDGYLYESLLREADNLPEPVRRKIKEVWYACSLYPKSTTQVF